MFQTTNQSFFRGIPDERSYIPAMRITTSTRPLGDLCVGAHLQKKLHCQSQIRVAYDIVLPILW